MSKEHREEKKRWQAAQTQAAIAALPLPNDELRDLFDHVDNQLQAHGCDHSMRFSLGWIEKRGFESGAILEWLNDNGGYCDCEVVTNAAPRWEELQPRRFPRQARKPEKKVVGPPPSSYEDEAVRFSLPRKPWKLQREPKAGSLLELRFGKAPLRVLQGTSKNDELDWCHRRGIELIRNSGWTGDAESYWDEYGMMVDELPPLSIGAVAGRVYRAGSPRRTHLFVWWHMDLHAQARVWELESELGRWEGDWREVCKMLNAVDLRAR